MNRFIALSPGDIIPASAKLIGFEKLMRQNGEIPIVLYEVSDEDFQAIMKDREEEQEKINNKNSILKIKK